MTVTALRLYPLPVREIPSGAIYEDIELPPPNRRNPSRPYVIVNAVASVDGRATIRGKSGGIGSEVDRRVMRTLRSRVGAVMIGANTLRAERLSLGLDEFSSGPQPIAAIVTTTGDVPLETNLLVNEQQEVLVVVAQDAPANKIYRLRERASVLAVAPAPSGSVDLVEALDALRTERGVETVLVEGGPTLNHSLISQDVADELFLTLSPKLIGDVRSHTYTMLEGCELPLPHILELLLVSVHLCRDELFLRYRFATDHTRYNST